MSSLIFKIAGLLGLCAALVAGFFSYRDSQREFGALQERSVTALLLKVQKADAAKLLETEKIKLVEADKLLATSIRKLGEQRAKLQDDNRANLRKFAAGYRLQYATQEGDGGGWGGGVSTAAGKTGTAIHATPAFIQLPDTLNSNLLKYAADAESLAIDYKVLYAYVNNPKLVCGIREGLP